MKNILYISFFLFLTACNRKKDYKEILHNPVLFSNTVHELNNIIMGNNFTPVVGSRNYLYASVAAYEVIAAGYPDKYHSLSGQLRGLPKMPDPVTNDIDFEFASLLSYCNLGEAVTFPAGSMSLYVDSLKKMATDHGMSKQTMQNSIAFSDTVSSFVMAWSKQDNYAVTRSSSKYVVADIPGRWMPTPPAYASAMEPHWNEIRPLVLDDITQFSVPPPVTFNMKDTNSQYWKQVVALKNTVDNLTDEQKHIADFWDDNPFKLNVVGHIMYGTKKFSPPGHWMSIIGIASKKANADFATTVYAYAKTSIALFDAFIQCWNAKYKYNTARPETVINKYIDAQWRPYLQTPPFPEYTCGHSTCSSAAAEVLTSVYGDNFTYTDTTELEFGIKSRSFTSFRAAAEENNSARFYGGIHFHSSCIVSTDYGRKVGNLIVTRLHMKKENALTKR
ncbi:MAG: phosphatidic acid phosphatase [Chitinophagaceae bacterium]|nr:phosphatidic acid phosphatase [Chitinophagaceae bacterium]